MQILVLDFVILIKYVMVALLGDYLYICDETFVILSAWFMSLSYM